MDDKVIAAALAGLLHDIGRFALRAANADPKEDTALKIALQTDHFLTHRLPAKWQALVRGTDEVRTGTAVALADVLAAGEIPPEGAGSPAAASPQLLSIFCSVKAGDLSAPKVVFWPLSPLALEEKALFPAPDRGKKAAAQRYAALWQDFETGAEELAAAFSGEGADFETYLDAMWMLLQRFTWCIPSAGSPARPDVSFFDQARVTAALAAALADSSLSDRRLAELLSAPKDSAAPVGVLVSGDLGGLQAFLYSISSRGASGALRGRSFYLQLLTEAAARYLLRRLGLPLSSLLYVGGGNFTLLARPGDADRLEEIQNEVARVLYAAHQGDLYLNLASIPLEARDCFDGRITRAWGDLQESLRAQKLRRFSGFGAALGQVFRPEGRGGGEESLCQVCGKEDPQAVVEGRDAGEVRKCRACVSYEALANDLRRARYLVLEKVEPGIPETVEAGPPLPYAGVLAQLGLAASLHQKLPAASEASRPRALLALDDLALGNIRPALNQAGGRRLLVNVTPLLTPAKRGELARWDDSRAPEVGSVLSFDLLERQARGQPRLGVLRMDVDDLGRMFSQGLGRQATLARFAALSFAVSLYFEGWVGALAWKINQERGDCLYSIYSSGDDLVFAGAWDAVVELARRVRRDLRRFAADHPGVHASAGIVLTGSRTSLAPAVLDATQAEARAKRLPGDGEKQEKDAVSFLGQVVRWDRFGLEEEKSEAFDTVHGLAHFLARRERLFPLLRELIHCQGMYLKAAAERREAARDRTRGGQAQALYGPWNWLATYQLSLAVEREGGRQEKKNLELLKTELESKNFTNIEWIGLAARWAVLSQKKGARDEQRITD